MYDSYIAKSEMREVYTTNEKSAVACKILAGKYDRQNNLGNIDSVEGKIVTCIFKKLVMIKLILFRRFKVRFNKGLL